VSSNDRARRPGAFRPRGLEMTRIETFTDAAFAFALTLLVVSLDPPNSFAELSLLVRDVPAFLLSAALLMMFWAGHNEWSRRYGLDDRVTYFLSAALVSTVLVYVYPLRFVFSLLTQWIAGMTGLPISSGRAVISGTGDVADAFLVYGVGFVAMCTILVLLYLHAWRKRSDLDLDPVERFDTVAATVSWSIVGAVGLVSLLVAALAPATWVGAPGWVYALLAIIMPLHGVRSERRRARLVSAGS
jgi:uncharacterized membrane protein